MNCTMKFILPAPNLPESTASPKCTRLVPLVPLHRPFRPIVSSIDTYNYNLAEVLCSLLVPFIPQQYTAQDTFTFVSEIANLSTPGYFMVSFDVESLFTNIKYILEGNPNLKLNQSCLKKLFMFATAETHFSFNGVFYDQTDGIAMGSSLAPVLANLFMGHHEKIWLENYQGPEVIFYRRYVDDTFCLFSNKLDALLFFDYINSQQRNIKFTMEKEENHQLPFLDVLIDNGQSEFPVTSVFRKKTYTGLLTNFFSSTPSSYKLGLIRTLVEQGF